DGHLGLIHALIEAVESIPASLRLGGEIAGSLRLATNTAEILVARLHLSGDIVGFLRPIRHTLVEAPETISAGLHLGGSIDGQLGLLHSLVEATESIPASLRLAGSIDGSLRQLAHTLVEAPETISAALRLAGEIDGSLRQLAHTLVEAPETIPAALYLSGGIDGLLVLRSILGSVPSEDRPIIGQADGTPFLVDWGRPVEESWQFRTEIIRSRNGIEQRIAQRAFPRVLYEFEGWLDRAHLHRLLRVLEVQQGAQNIFVPHPRDSAPLLAAVAPAQGTLPIGEARWKGEAEQVFISDRENSEVLRSGRRNADGSIVVSPLTRPHSAGVQVYRMVEGMLIGETSVTARSRRAARTRVELLEDPEATWYDPALVEVVNPVIDGFEYLASGPNWRTPIRSGYLQEREELDLVKGRIVREFDNPLVRWTTQANYTVASEEDRKALLGLFYRCRGAQRPFYIDTLLDGLELAEDIEAGTRRAVFVGTEVQAGYESSTAYRRFRLRARGVDQIQHITALQVQGNNTVVELANPWDGDVAAGDVFYISWISLSRFETDLLTLQWQTRNLGTARVTTRVLPDTIVQTV
ncbi:MAG: hypothetical protein OXC11_02085, partial [Rhodospirillales bacterium]|nr:hypothetical protein [Rhodospirillales bacterium]